MSTNKLSHLKEWEKIYLEVTRRLSVGDDGGSIKFQANDCNVYLSDDDTFYTLEELKQLANDGMPKQGDMIEVRWTGVLGWSRYKLIAFYEWKVITEYWIDNPVSWDEWRPLPKKTELTLAEVEERLGLDAWSLIIK